ncbi:MAG: hypothetical protein R3B60_03390 [Candidatus Paceibacterota bacterium]
MFIINGILYPSVFCAPYIRGFTGEELLFHKLLRLFGATWENTGFAGKTMTLTNRKGNMPLQEDGMTPKETLPRCIWVNPFKNGGEIINAVGLANNGLDFYLKLGVYQRFTEPFIISIALESKSNHSQIMELQAMCRLIKDYGPYNGMAVQINCGCPNSDVKVGSFNSEICNLLNSAKAILGPKIPVLLNCNALMPTEVLTEVVKVADALWVGNTIPWRDTETLEEIDWNSIGDKSPLRHRGIKADGGLSSHQCLKFTIKKVKDLRERGVQLPIIAGNGIRTISDINDLKEVGANAIFLGSVAVVRPWRMKKLISHANHVFA